MKILAIETSCDETAVAVLQCTGDLPTPDFRVLGNSLQSQIHIHKEYGGVYPMLAKREHIKNLPILLDKTMKEAGNSDVDYVAVTAGPGLEPALWTGIEFAKELGQKWNKPVLPINHMEGHLFSYLFEKGLPISFPAIALLVSGGHTELVLVEGFDKYKVIGQTRDDAVGEAFDKTARILGFPYPGGPKISELAALARKRNSGQTMAFRFPSPMIDSKDFDFSYSGLKTAVLYHTRKLGEMSMETKEDIARAFEDAAIEPLIEKTKKAVEKHDAKTLLVGGGVAANKYLREKLALLSVEMSLDLRLPIPLLTTDNAVMIAIAAYVRILTARSEAPAEIVARGRQEL